MEQSILSVTQINEKIRGLLENTPQLASLAIRGEISNYKRYPSGHHYFTLKDENSALKCVMFKGNAFRLRFQPENGMKIIAFGSISVYPRDGAYQLYCTAMTIDGIGDLHAAFSQLKNKLESLGLFDTSHKKPIPKFPETIGIITSSAGAAVHDILRVLNKRWPIVRVRLFPVRVQGTEAPGEIASAIAYANRFRLADVLIVGRGGGSIEDLWAFNDEKVAYAIYNSTIPVISAVGHEPDVTISDYVADLRAATPSNAAELVVPDQNNIRQYFDQRASAMGASLKKQISNARFYLDTLRKSAVLKSPHSYIFQKKTALQMIMDRLSASADRKISKNKQRYVQLASALDAMSPLKVLSRGYSIVTKKDGTVINKAAQINIGEQIDITLSDGNCIVEVIRKKEAFHE